MALLMLPDDYSGQAAQSESIGTKAAVNVMRLFAVHFAIQGFNGDVRRLPIARVENPRGQVFQVD